jgi:hypothetical protein
VVVNPALAAPFAALRTRATQLAIAIIDPGIAVALAGYPWIGGGNPVAAHVEGPGAARPAALGDTPAAPA